MIRGVVQTKPWYPLDTGHIPATGVRLIVDAGQNFEAVAAHCQALRRAGHRITYTLSTSLTDEDEWAARTRAFCRAMPPGMVEVWNEPRPDDWARYWRFLEVASPIIRSDDRHVCLGGQPPATAEVFWRAARVRGMFRHVDVVGLHPYIFDPSRQIAFIAARRIQLHYAGVSLPINITEFGWGTGTGPMAVPGELTQATLLRQSFTLLAAESERLGIERAHWFSLRDWPGGTNWDHHAGLITDDGRRKPAYEALANLGTRSG